MYLCVDAATSCGQAGGTSEEDRVVEGGPDDRPLVLRTLLQRLCEGSEPDLHEGDTSTVGTGASSVEPPETTAHRIYRLKSLSAPEGVERIEDQIIERCLRHPSDGDLL